MSDSEQEQVLKHASDCAEGECSIDEVSELLAVLKDTEKELEDRLERIMNMVSHLQHLNEKEERQKDEVRAFVKDLLRVFAGDVSNIYGNGCETTFSIISFVPQFLLLFRWFLLLVTETQDKSHGIQW